MKPRIFLGSSGQQEKLLAALTRGLGDIADVDPWTTVFNPGLSTLDRLVELTHEVDFAAFVFAQDDWTTRGLAPDAVPGEAAPRDNVVFEAGLFGGATPTAMRQINDKLREAIEAEGRINRLEGDWWQCPSPRGPSASLPRSRC
jgi:predicted nucleotide-binding protein